MNISVVIPVYNAKKFVTEAVDSALAQPETAEVILIEDNSPDGSLFVCQALAEQHDKVRLLRHPGCINRGEAASRNLGMQNAQYDYIAFLDADDYYLPDRFKVSRVIFDSDPTCEGVYDAMGGQFESEAARERWLNNSPVGNAEMTTMTEIVPPEKLFEKLVAGDAGYFHICGLVIKKAVLQKSGFMNEALRLHTDTDYVRRVAAVAILRAGDLDQPVVVRRVHEQNTISAPRTKQMVYKDHMKMWMATYNWLDEKGLEDKKKIIYCALLNYVAHCKPLTYEWLTKIPTVSGQPSFVAQLARLSLLPFDHPMVIFTWGYWKAIISIILSAMSRNLGRLFKFFDRTSKKPSQ
jgi:glycosyltransferase involved in cell wall biosynthesis